MTRLVLQKADALLGRVERAFALIGAAAIFALMGLGVVQITARQFFNLPIFGYIDIIELLMPVFVFLALAHVEQMRGHIRIDLVLRRLHWRSRRVVDLIACLLGLAVIAVLARFGFDHAYRAYEFSDSTMDAQYLWWPSKAVIPIALTLLWCRLLLTTLNWGRRVQSMDGDGI